MRLPKGKSKYDDLLGAIETKDLSTQVQDNSKTQTLGNTSTETPKKLSRTQLLKQGKVSQAKMLLDADTYKHFRMACIDLKVEMSDVVEGLIKNWLVTYESKKD